MKIVIVIKGGRIHEICTSENANIAIIDHDMADIGENPVEIREPDAICEPDIFLTSLPIFEEAKEQLKKLKF